MAFSTDFTRKSGVFYRFNAKNWRFRQILREKVAFFTDFTRKIGGFQCKFYLQKFCPCKKNNKYKVWTHIVLREGGGQDKYFFYSQTLSLQVGESGGAPLVRSPHRGHHLSPLYAVLSIQDFEFGTLPWHLVVRLYDQAFKLDNTS